MNLETTIIGAIMLVLFIVPFVFLSGSTKSKEKKLLQSLSAIAGKHNCKVTQHQVSREQIIGLDESANFVFFYKKVNGKEIVQHINLSEIQHCSVINLNRTFKNKKSSQQVIDKLGLNFIPVDKSKPETLLEFYTSENNQQLNGELDLIEKWAKIVNNKLKLQKS